MHNLALVGHAYVRAHDASKKNAHKFMKISYSGIISFVYAGKEEIHKYMQYEVSMTVLAG